MIEFFMEKDRLNVLMAVQYAYDEISGVARWAVEAKPHIEGKTGGKVVVAFPRKKGDAESRLPEGGVFLGKSHRFKGYGTEFQSSGGVSKKEVRKVLIGAGVTTIDIAHFEEPLVGFGVSGVIRALPDAGLVCHVHAYKENLDFGTKLGFHGIKALKYHTRIMKKMDRTLAVSEVTADAWREFWPIEYDIVPNGINTDELKSDGPIIKEWEKMPGKKTILFVGRHDKRKDVKSLLIAFSFLRKEREDIQLKIAGSGDTTYELEKMVDDRQIPDVEFLGKLPRAEDDPDKIDLIKAYRTADVFVGPSKDGEAFNRTDAEALSSGTMAVTTAIPGHIEAFGRALGGVVFVRPSNPESLARGIATVLDLSEEARERLGRQGREHIVKNYSWPIVADKLVTVYEEVIAAKRDGVKPSVTIYKRK